MTRERYLKENGPMMTTQMIKPRKIKSRKNRNRFWVNANGLIVTKMMQPKIFSWIKTLK
jgi:hypothetical protein